MLQHSPTPSRPSLHARPQCAHIMAMAVQRLFKDAQVTIGPWIERGFYYDFDMKEPFSEKDLKAIQKEMRKIIKMNLPFIREEVRRAGTVGGVRFSGKSQLLPQPLGST
jgi:threonyl-tRNA synthetase